MARKVTAALLLSLLGALWCTADARSGESTAAGRGAASRARESYERRYGAFFVWHALSATAAWALVLPLAQLVQAVAAAGRFQLHRRTMLLVLAATLQTHLLAALFARERAPAQHAALGSALLLGVSLQAAAGALRPHAQQPPSAWRVAWARAHRLWGLGCFLLALFLLHHSLYVFRPSRWLVWLVNGCVLFALAAFVAVVALKLARWSTAADAAADDKQLDLQHVEVQTFLPG